MWPFLVRVYFFLRLRKLVNDFQRWWKNEHKAKRAKLPDDFETPEDVEAFIKDKFQWPPDGTRLFGRFIALDYITHPEVFHARITDGVRHEEGDCDDFHAWVATVLQSVPGVSHAYLHSTVWNGGGHTTAVYEYKGMYFGFNYRIGIVLVADTIEEIGAMWAKAVLTWAQGKEDAEPDLRIKFWCLETVSHKLVATGK